MHPTPPGTTPPDDAWRQTHLGRLLGHAMRRFDARVLQLMARNVEVPLALSNLVLALADAASGGGRLFGRHRRVFWGISAALAAILSRTSTSRGTCPWGATG